MEISGDFIFILCVFKTHTRGESLITIANKCMRKGELREGVFGFGGMISQKHSGSLSDQTSSGKRK